MTGGGRFECGVCWRVYDPREGDQASDIAPGTSFDALPESWRCPNCDTEKARFLALDPEPRGDSRLAALAAAYRDAEARMRPLEIFNPALTVELVGFEAFGEDRLGVAVTPWFMNLVLLPGGELAAAPGEKMLRTLPAGIFEFVVGHLDGVGLMLSRSLLSPVFELKDQAMAKLAAEAALREVLQPEIPAPASLNRRALLLGSGA